MTRLLIAAYAACCLAACGGGASAPAGDGTGIVSIAITDAAVDSVSVVMVEFTGVELKAKNGENVVEIFDSPKSIDLLELQDGRTEELLPDTRVDAGEYNWIRLAVNAEVDNIRNSYVITETGEEVELGIPSGSQSGLKLVSGFTVTQNGATNLVIDWDLRKALSNPTGQPGMHLRPALRITDMAMYGTLRGTVAEALTMADECGEDSSVGNAVYLYEGTVDTPMDIRAAETDPVATATVAADLGYSISYLSPGDYTAAFTCHANLDDTAADAIDEIVFSVVDTEVTIVDGETTVLDFAALTM
ncbi:MAG: DUF4382 domain-containing protein [Gammaproteobacteria bacterium]|nr:DUF4382 domain-containing protein [Gammaproteobacteria bacterium]NNC57055.1 DUF4382 domain-containing protein [Woeseiaceae bacterium]